MKTVYITVQFNGKPIQTYLFVMNVIPSKFTKRETESEKEGEGEEETVKNIYALIHTLSNNKVIISMLQVCIRILS